MSVTVKYYEFSFWNLCVILEENMEMATSVYLSDPCKCQVTNEENTLGCT